MKKLLLATSAAAIAVSSVAQADAPKITVGGFTDWQVGVMSDDADANQRSQAFFNDTEIHFNIDGKTQGGLGYGAVIQLEADITADADDNSSRANAAQTYIYLDGGWGRVELGSGVGAASTMKVDAATIARASGGIDGDWWRYANNPSSTTYIARPDLPLGYGIHSGSYGAQTTENRNKVTYYTPRWNGLQAGLSYSPNDTDRGQTINRADNRGSVALPDAFFSFSRAENIFSGGVSYEREYQGVGISLAATAEHGDAEDNTAEDLFAWTVGANLDYMGFSFAGSYGDWGDSLGAKGNAQDENSYWTAGASYATGPYGVSVTYLQSDVERSTGFGTNEFENLVFSADYALAPGLTPYAELSLYDADSQGTTNDNDGHVFILGTQLNF